MFNSQGSRRELGGGSSDEERVVKKVGREEIKMVKLKIKEQRGTLIPIILSREIKRKYKTLKGVKRHKPIMDL